MGVNKITSVVKADSVLLGLALEQPYYTRVTLGSLKYKVFKVHSCKTFFNLCFFLNYGDSY